MALAWKVMLPLGLLNLVAVAVLAEWTHTPGQSGSGASLLVCLGGWLVAGVAWMTVPREVYETSGASAEDLDGFVDYPRSIAGIEVALLFRTTTKGDTKVSFRSNGLVDVNKIAREFGGGGHAMASGALVRGSLEEVRDHIVDASREAVRSATGRRGRSVRRGLSRALD